MKKFGGILFLLFVTASFAFADIAPGRAIPPKQNSSAEKVIPGKMFIRVKSDVKEPTLIVKRGSLSRLRAAIDEADDSDRQTLAENTGSSNFSRTQTIVSGLFFSLAFIFGGVWMFRSKGASSKFAAPIIVLAILSAGAGIVFANTPPPFAVELTSRIFSPTTYAYGWAEGDIKIKISDEDMRGYDFRLEIPDAENKNRNDE